MWGSEKLTSVSVMDVKLQTGLATLLILVVFSNIEGQQISQHLAKQGCSNMSYSEALHLATHGHIFRGILNAMKCELVKAELYGDLGYIIQIKVNLGVAHMRLASRIFYPNVYMKLYSESEKYFLSVLDHDPGHQLAKDNLAICRKNKEIRPAEEPEWPTATLPVQSPFRPSVVSADSQRLYVSGETDETGFGRRWLTIGIPTVPRRGNPDYLQRTVSAIISQLPTRSDDPLFGRVVVVILNNIPGEHALFDELRRQVEAGPHRRYFRFEEATVVGEDGIESPKDHIWIPGHQVRTPHTPLPPSRLQNLTTGPDGPCPSPPTPMGR